MYEASRALTRVLTAGEAAAVAVRHGMSALRASAGRVALFLRSDRDLELVAESGEVRFDAAPALAQAIADRRIVCIDDRAIAAPLSTGERTHGAMSFAFSSTRSFAARDRRFVATLARHTAESIERSREAERRRDEVLAIVAHELRNPLEPIRFALQALQVTHGSNPALDRTISIIGRQVSQMERIVYDLLEISRLGLGKEVLSKAPLDLVELVRTAVEDHRAMIERRGLVLTFECTLSRLTASVDRARIGQVLTNLLGNAAKFTDPGGRISVRVDLEGARRARIAIRDSGIGMTHETLTGMFKPFAQGERGLDRSRWGLGVGLALARELVRLHGGEISARSDGPNHGSEVVVVLPVEIANDADEEIGALIERRPKEGSAEASIEDGRSPARR